MRIFNFACVWMQKQVEFIFTGFHAIGQLRFGPLDKSVFIYFIFWTKNIFLLLRVNAWMPLSIEIAFERIGVAMLHICVSIVLPLASCEINSHEKKSREKTKSTERSGEKKKTSRKLNAYAEIDSHAQNICLSYLWSSSSSHIRSFRLRCRPFFFSILALVFALSPSQSFISWLLLVSSFFSFLRSADCWASHWGIFCVRFYFGFVRVRRLAHSSHQYMYVAI